MKYVLALILALSVSSHTTQVLPKPNRPVDLVKAHVLPDPDLTPGAILSDVTLEDVKKPNFSATVRNVTESEKKEVFRRYGIDPRNIHPGEYEIDHAVPCSLGGAQSVENLWPQSYTSKPLNAHVKDQLEDKLLKLVRAGKVPLAQAQRDIASDWTKAYQKYVGPLPK